MKQLKYFLVIILLTYLSNGFAATSSSAESFTISDIKVNGLKRITASTFFNYLPVKKNDTINENKFPEIIRQLYKTNFFEKIELNRDKNILIVDVEERPIIGELNVTGNKELSKENLDKGLHDMGLAIGDSFDPMRLEQSEKDLLNLYYSRSKYDVIIDMKYRPISEGRVAIDIKISEGISARIQQINIVGNAAFSKEVLLAKIKQKTSRWYSVFTKSDQYSGEKLKADLDSLESFYLDRGFLDYTLESTLVSLTSDKKGVYITINIKEGLPYKIKTTSFTGDDLITKANLEKAQTYKNGDYYNRSAIRKTVNNIKELYGEKGYAFVSIQSIPQINKETHEVSVDFSTARGKKTYVRRITFAGNYQTNDEVLRREMRQMESSLYDSKKIERSEERLHRLGNITSVVKKEVPVPGEDNQVDLVYQIVENPTSSFSFGVGYGSESKLVLNAGYSTGNFFGTGNRFDMNFVTSDSEKDYSINFTDPYWTIDGISRNYKIYYNETNEKDLDIADWSSDNYGLFVNFGIPLDEYKTFYIGGGYRGIKINPGPDAPQEILDELASNGTDRYNELVLNLNWTLDTRDRTVFANKGSITRLNSEIVLPGTEYSYYKLGVRHRNYFTLTDNLIFSSRADVSYGNSYGSSTDGLPFYRRYYAGGLTTVRGYRSNSLGPKYANGDVAGGDFRVTGGAELIFPLALGTDSDNVRLGTFTDFGNVYSTFSDFDAGEFRYSAGLYLLWQSPIGPLNFSYAKPLNKKEGDKAENFQFTIGVPF